MDAKARTDDPGGAATLAEVAVGSRAVLRYTRTDDRLVGLDLAIQP